MYNSKNISYKDIYKNYQNSEDISYKKIITNLNGSQKVVSGLFIDALAKKTHPKEKLQSKKCLIVMMFSMNLIFGAKFQNINI